MEIVENFGLDPILLVGQIVNFLIILFILRKFLYKPILNILEKRKIAIKEGLDKAEEAQIRLEKVVEKEKRILRTAQDQARKIIEEAKNESSAILQKTEEQSRSKANDILKQAREQIYLETKEAERNLAIQISRLAVEFIEKSREELFSREDQELVMKNALKKLRKRVD